MSRRTIQVELEIVFLIIRAHVQEAFANHHMQFMHRWFIPVLNTHSLYSQCWTCHALQSRFTGSAHYQNIWQRLIDCDKSGFNKLSLSDISNFIKIYPSHQTCLVFLLQFCIYVSKYNYSLIDLTLHLLDSKHSQWESFKLSSYWEKSRENFVNVEFNVNYQFFFICFMRNNYSCDISHT